MYGVRALSNAVFCNNCIPPFLFAVFVGVGKLFLAVATSTNGFLHYNSVVLRRPKYAVSQKTHFVRFYRKVPFCPLSRNVIFRLMVYTFWRTHGHIYNIFVIFFLTIFPLLFFLSFLLSFFIVLFNSSLSFSTLSFLLFFCSTIFPCFSHILIYLFSFHYFKFYA